MPRCVTCHQPRRRVRYIVVVDDACALDDDEGGCASFPSATAAVLAARTAGLVGWGLQRVTP